MAYKLVPKTAGAKLTGKKFKLVQKKADNGRTRGTKLA